MGAVYARLGDFILGALGGLLCGYWPASLSTLAFVIMLDLAEVPALIFARLWRGRPSVPQRGAGIMVMMAIVAGVFGLGPTAVEAEFRSLISAQAIRIIGLSVLLVGYEARAYWSVVCLRRLPPF